jgi:transposase, IS6 family
MARRTILTPAQRAALLALPADRAELARHYTLTRNARMERFKRQAQELAEFRVQRENARHPREIVTDRLKGYPGAIREMKREGELWRFVRHRRGRWLNNRVEQDHRRVKRRIGPMLGFGGFWTARRTLAGVEAMAMLAKGQVRAVPTNDMPAQRAFVYRVFGLAA